MYLRHATTRKDGKAYAYWRHVRSVRRNGKVVQETVPNWGNSTPQGDVEISDRRVHRQAGGRGGVPHRYGCASRRDAGGHARPSGDRRPARVRAAVEDCASSGRRRIARMVWEGGVPPQK